MKATRNHVIEQTGEETQLFPSIDAVEQSLNNVNFRDDNVLAHDPEAPAALMQKLENLDVVVVSSSSTWRTPPLIFKTADSDAQETSKCTT